MGSAIIVPRAKGKAGTIMVRGLEPDLQGLIFGIARTGGRKWMVK